MYGSFTGAAVRSAMRGHRVYHWEAGQAGQAVSVVCRGHAGKCHDSQRSEKEESRIKLTLERAKELMEKNNGNLDLSGTSITALPDNLTVGGWLDLSGTEITALPDNLTVGDWLDLSGTKITALQDNLTVGGGLDLSGTGITELPDNLTVGGWLDLSNTKITNPTVKRLRHGEYVPGKYLYADGILTHVKKKKKAGDYTVFVGKIPGHNVVFDGKHYAHCRTLREGIADLLFKSAIDRGADQYKGISLDDPFTVEELKRMYRVITGACKAGTESFVNSLKDLKDKYTVREVIEMTDGQYNAEKFKEFFEGANE